MPRRGTEMAGHAPVLVTAFLALMGVAWLMATPPGSAFDEPAHYVKAIGVGHGEFRGHAQTARPGDLRKLFEVGKHNPDLLKAFGNTLSSSASRWQARTTRRFDVPSALYSRRLGCTYGRPAESAACLDRPESQVQPAGPVGSYVGTYQPYLYLPAGLVMRFANHPYTAVRLGRAATLLVGLVLLVAAVWLLWSPAAGSLSLLGLVLAVTPMVIFVASVLSPSGPEVAAAVCFTAALMRLARRDRAPGWIWAPLAAGGVVLAAARPLGPAFVALILVTVAALAGPLRFMSAVRAGGRVAVAAALGIATAMALGLWWQFTRQPRPSPNRTGVVDAIGPSWEHLDEIAHEAIGVFGALDAPIPDGAELIWYGLLAALALGALLVGSPRERLSVLALPLLAVAVTMVMSLVYREIGPLHGRYPLPFLVLVPLWFGEIVLRSRERLPVWLARALPIVIFAGAAGVHVWGWWTSSQRFAVGNTGPSFFFGSPEWSPPGGWWPWLVAVLLAAAAYLATPREHLRAG